MTLQIAVCGPRHCTEKDKSDAYRIGQLLADAGVTVICGGGIGVMDAVAAGVRHRNGTVIGIRPSASRDGASEHLSATIVTNLGEARNAVIVWSADAVISVGGSWGTLSEVALAMRRGEVPVISINGWRIADADGTEVDGPVHVDTAEQAVEQAVNALRREDRPRPPVVNET